MQQEVTIKTETTGDDDMTGKITFVSPVPGVAATTNTDNSAQSTNATASNDYPIEITIDNPSDRLRIGMTAKVTIIESQVKDALTLPDNAVQTDTDGNYYVEVVTDEEAGTTQQINVTYGLKTDYYVQVEGEGLSEGMNVIVNDDSTYSDTTDTDGITDTTMEY